MHSKSGWHLSIMQKGYHHDHQCNFREGFRPMPLIETMTNVSSKTPATKQEETWEFGRFSNALQFAKLGTGYDAVAVNLI